MLQIGVSGHELTARERDWLQHDACAGVVLFARNFASQAQVAELTQAIAVGGQQIRILAQLAGQPEEGFLRTQLTRELNRTRAAVREAMRELGSHI